MRNCRLDRRWPQVYGLKPVDPEQLIVTPTRGPPTPSIPPLRATVSARTRWILAAILPWEAHQWPLPSLLWGEFHTLGPIFPVTGVWWLKCIKKGGSTTKRQWFSELSPQFRRGNKFKSQQEGCNENETRNETVLGRRGWKGRRVKGWWRGRGRESDGVVWRVMMTVVHRFRLPVCGSG